MKCLDSLSIERNYRAAIIFQKSSVRSFSDNFPLHEYQDYLMPYAFSHVMKQFKLAQKVKVTASIDSKSCTTKFYSNERTIVTSKLSCECGFFKAMQLPCRHIFSLCQHTHLNPFVDQLCALRWTCDYYKKSQYFLLLCEHLRLL